MLRPPPRSILFPYHDALPISREMDSVGGMLDAFTSKEQICFNAKVLDEHLPIAFDVIADLVLRPKDRKSTRLNSSHVAISYAVFCLKKKKKKKNTIATQHTNI